MQKEMSERLGISEAEVSRWLSLDIAVTPDEIVRWAQAVGYPIAFFFQDMEEIKAPYEHQLTEYFRNVLNGIFVEERASPEDRALETRDRVEREMLDSWINEQLGRRWVDLNSQERQEMLRYLVDRYQTAAQPERGRRGGASGVSSWMLRPGSA